MLYYKYLDLKKLNMASITESIINFLADTVGNDLLTLFIVSFIPLVELRGGIILSAGMDIHPAIAYLICVLGASVIVFPLIYSLKPLLNRLKRWRLTKRFAESAEGMIFDRAKSVLGTANRQKTKRLTPEIKKCLALFAFVAIPIPFTGAWTGSAIAALLDVKAWKAGLFIIAGHFLSGAIMTTLVIFAAAYVDLILFAFIGCIAFILIIVLWTKMLKMRKENRLKTAENGGEEQ